MQAIIQTGGQQFTVKEGDTINVDLLKEAQVGGEVTFDDVRMVMSDGGVKIGAPKVDGAAVKATVLEMVKGPKVRCVFFRRRKDSRTVKGHRQRYHKVKITGIQG